MNVIINNCFILIRVVNSPRCD